MKNLIIAVLLIILMGSLVFNYVQFSTKNKQLEVVYIDHLLPAQWVLYANEKNPFIVQAVKMKYGVSIPKSQGLYALWIMRGPDQGDSFALDLRYFLPIRF